MFEWFGEDSSEWNRRALEEAGVHAMGRRSYEIMGPHWAASEGPIATAMNEKPKAVFSNTLEKTDWGPVEIVGGDLSAEIADLKARDDEGTVLVHGGPAFAKSLTRLGLIDEYQLTTVPIAIGAGRSPFAELDEHLKLDVVEEERFRSGALAQRQTVMRKGELDASLLRAGDQARPGRGSMITTVTFGITPGYGEKLHDALGYSGAVRVGDRVETSGQGGVDDDLVIPDLLEDEIVRAFDNVERTLATVGATWKDVIHVNSYHKVAPGDDAIGNDHNRVMAEQFRRRLDGRAPIWTETGVTVLGLATMRVEIRVTAIVGSGS